jgi:hypothetical protein
MKITGQCHCGAISFKATVDPQRVLVCHCADCQQFSGGPYRTVLPTPAEDVVIAGVAKHYVKVAASGNRRVQAFCPDCGTQLYATEAEGAPKVLNIRLGCVNERASLEPHAQIWGESAMPWLSKLGSVPIHGKGTASPLMHPDSRTPGESAA